MGGKFIPEVGFSLVICVEMFSNGRAIGELCFDLWLEQEIQSVRIAPEGHSASSSLSSRGCFTVDKATGPRH